MPSHMTVREGIDPTHEDKDVLFRTTHYIRVVDLCKKDNQVTTDNLYRFRMTGQAGALGSTVKFESGFLSKAQVDPFGAPLKGQCQAGPTGEKKENCPPDPPPPKIVPPGGGAGVGAAGGAGAVSSDVTADCSNGKERRGFQVLGPQGVETYDQDMRLVMSMTSEAKPLIGTLTQASALLSSTYRQDLGPIVMKERNRELQARNLLLENQSSGKNAVDMIDAIIKTMGGPTP
ncbi:MAG: hypothetical protein HQL95_10900 [Magnetococcales bacterium]|nr:hypothetical protein [Magnetococcales bacterium]